MNTWTPLRPDSLASIRPGDLIAYSADNPCCTYTVDEVHPSEGILSVHDTERASRRYRWYYSTLISGIVGSVFIRRKQRVLCPKETT